MTRPYPISSTFIAMRNTLAELRADSEITQGPDEVMDVLCTKFSEAEKALTTTPVKTVGDLMLKLEVIINIALNSEVDAAEWQALADDVARLNGSGMSFVETEWLRQWEAAEGGYLRTDDGITAFAPKPLTARQGELMRELEQAKG